MKTLYKNNSRGYADHGWLKSNFTFSFADYYNPERTHFGTLRVFNDDIIAPSLGFGEHPHSNMEIISIPISGALKHKDSTGNTFVINENDVQIMSAGTGLTHSEYNASDSEDANFLQLWIFPKKKDIAPRYEQKTFADRKKNEFTVVVSPEERKDTLWINQDAYISIGEFEKGKEITYSIKKDKNKAFIFVMSGEIDANGTKLENRDSLGIEDEKEVVINISADSKVLIVEVP